MEAKIILGRVSETTLSGVKWLTIFMLAIAPYGCVASVYCLNDVCDMSLKEVAVVSEGDYVEITRIDDDIISVPGTHWEYHLAPGLHTITSRYVNPMWDYVAHGEEASKTHNFEAGHVYRLRPSTPLLPFFKKYLPKPEEVETVYKVPWELTIRDLGTVEEEASRQASKAFAPGHWRKLAEESSRKKAGN